MNNWRDITKEVPDCSKLKSARIRVKYIYYFASTPTWATFPSCFDHMINKNLPSKPFVATLSPHIGVGTIHIDPPKFNDDGEYLLSGGYRFSDLKGDHQTLTHWMYLDDPYDESEENVDGQLLMDYDGKVKEPTSVKILELDKPNKMRRKYDPENIASIINEDPRFKENNMEFLKEVTIKTFDVSCFEEGAAYLCTPLDYPNQKFIGIFESGDIETITFVIADNYSQNNIKKITADDAHNWTIEKMIEPMTDEEIKYIQDLITRHILSAPHAESKQYKKIGDSIFKKLGVK